MIESKEAALSEKLMKRLMGNNETTIDWLREHVVKETGRIELREEETRLFKKSLDLLEKCKHEYLAVLGLDVESDLFKQEAELWDDLIELQLRLWGKSRGRSADLSRAAITKIKQIIEEEGSVFATEASRQAFREAIEPLRLLVEDDRPLLIDELGNVLKPYRRRKFRTQLLYRAVHFLLFLGVFSLVAYLFLNLLEPPWPILIAVLVLWVVEEYILGPKFRSELEKWRYTALKETITCFYRARRLAIYMKALLEYWFPEKPQEENPVSSP